MYSINSIMLILLAIKSGETAASRYTSRFSMKLDHATFGMGCFWGPQKMFDSIPGVSQSHTFEWLYSNKDTIIGEEFIGWIYRRFQQEPYLQACFIIRFKIRQS